MRSSDSLCLLAFATSALAAPHEKKQLTAPTATVKNGTVVGSTTGGIDSFMGIPFALPPTGTLRLKPPQSYDQTYPGGSFTATGTPAACPQFFLSQPSELDSVVAEYTDFSAALDSYFTPPGAQSENCLTLNVQRPSGTTADSALPVVFWIYGGGFEFGSTSTYDGSQFLQEGVTGLAAGHPVIFVAVNYRVSGFGFLAGSELKADGSTNLGLRDQRLGLEWVAENIAAFGGDPSKVVIWGESAGSISVFDHLVINSGDNTYNGAPLFRGAIMDSGSVVPTEPVDTGKAQAIYDAVVEAAGCSSSADTLTCLRAVDYGTLQAAITSVPSIFSYSSLDLSYLPRPDDSDGFFPESPDQLLAAGNWAKVPLIIGDQEDEGTLFSLVQSNISTTAELITYLQSYFPVSGSSLVPGLVATYSSSASAGSPYGTGPLYELYPQYKRLASILGDITFTLTRRAMLAATSASVSTWSYIDSHLYGLPILGTFHATDIFESYFGLPDPSPATTYRTFYTAFAYYLDPNGISAASSLGSWPEWSNSGREVLSIAALGNSVGNDTFREASYQYLLANQDSFRV